MKKRIVCVIMILLLISTIPVCGATALTKAQTDKYLYDISYYEQYNITNPSYGSVGGEWMVMGLARYGAVTRETLSTYKSNLKAVSYTHLRAHETRHDLVCRLLLEKKKTKTHKTFRSC